MQHDGNTLGDAIKEKKRVFRELTPKEKVVFIWDYYKVHILLSLLVIFVAGSLLHHYLYENQDILIYGVQINVLSEEMTAEDLPAAYMDFAESDPKEYQVNYETNLFMGVENEIEADTDYGTVMKMSSLIAARALDFLICDTYAFENYEAFAGYYDLQELLPAEIYDQLEAEGRIIFGQATNEDTATRLDEYAMAIDITDTDFAKTYDMKAYDGGPLYLTIMTNTKRVEESINLIRFIFGLDYVPTVSE